MSKDWNSQDSCFDPRTLVREFQSRVSSSYDLTRNLGILEGLSLGQLTLVESGVSLGIPVVSSIFVVLGKFPIVEDSNFFVVGRVYSFLVSS